ncbi:MAG: type I glyceraldehyde-3-phosphate dehydrogenase [Desulfobulbaceae bacterium]|nr:type I glyceraldehyde-3-phosphate dehydrogenase [Desulfobulbaceae bacterium]
MTRVAINGLGRIGRATLKIVMETPGLELVAVNDLTPADNLAYLLKYDSAYRRYGKRVDSTENGLLIDGREFPVYSQKDPAELRWKKERIDLVFECTGIFTSREGMAKHIEAGARRVILSAPETSGEVSTVVHGVNSPDQPPQLISCASCTTNCITPLVEIIGRRLGLQKAAMTTVHAYTSTQNIVDGPRKKWERGRAAAMNFVPTTTGAAKATGKALPEYAEVFDGIAIRGPVSVGSIADLVFVTSRKTSVQEVNDIFREEAAGARYRNIVGVSEDPLVSSDIIGDSRASIVDLIMTQVTAGDLVKVLSWYDNEWGYSAQMVREAVRISAG